MADLRDRFLSTPGLISSSSSTISGESSSLTLCGVRSPVVLILIFNSESPGVEETEGASPDFVELAGVGSDCLVDRRGGIVAGSCSRVV